MLRNWKETILGASALALLVSVTASAVPCPPDHCTKFPLKPRQREMLDKACGEAGKPHAIVPYEDDFCTCPCSCYGGDANLASADGEVSVEKIEKGSTLTTLAGEVQVAQPTVSDVTNHNAVQVRFSNGRELLLSTNHPLVLEGNLVAHADSLKVGSRVLGVNGDVVTVKAITPTKYSGNFRNVILKGNRPDGKDRIVMSEGVQSGDLFVQTFRDRLDQNVQLRDVIKESNLR